jgi:hypothetical protein
MGIRERLMTKMSLDTSHCLLIEYIKDARVALLFGYAKKPKKLRDLLGEMRKNGFEVVSGVALMAMVYPLGNGMFRYIGSEKCIGPVRLCTTTRGRWFDIAKKYGMKAEVIDSMCGMK